MLRRVSASEPRLARRLQPHDWHVYLNGARRFTGSDLRRPGGVESGILNEHGESDKSVGTAGLGGGVAPGDRAKSAHDSTPHRAEAADFGGRQIECLRIGRGPGGEGAAESWSGALRRDLRERRCGASRVGHTEADSGSHGILAGGREAVHHESPDAECDAPGRRALSGTRGEIGAREISPEISSEDQHGNEPAGTVAVGTEFICERAGGLPPHRTRRHVHALRFGGGFQRPPDRRAGRNISKVSGPDARARDFSGNRAHGE